MTANFKYQFIRSATVIVVVALSTSGCVSENSFDPIKVVAQVNPTPTPGSGGPNAGVDNFSPPSVANNTKIDLVFVVDNSGSMGGEQAILAASMAAFIDNFVLRGADYRIALLSTDVSTNFSGSAYAAYSSPARGNWLTKHTGFAFLSCDANCTMAQQDDVKLKFKQNVNLGVNGSGDERAIDSLMYATDAAHLAGPNAGFFRADSYKAIISVSDENHGVLDGLNAASTSLVQSAIARMQSLGTGGYGFYFVSDLDAVPADNSDGNGTNEYPAFYREMANITGSLMLNIRSPSWGNDLVQVGDDIITAAQKEFKLSKLPIAGTIVVKINGVVVPENAVNGWQYHAAPQNSIELYGTAKTSAAGQALRVEYMY